jgi:DNA-binding YbaB/EbfC family protein
MRLSPTTPATTEIPKERTPMKNLADMMKQVTQMQSRMQEAQARLEATLVTGQSGAGLITVTMNGKGAVTGVAIDPSLIVPADKEILEDLLVTALADARAKMEDAVAREMSAVTGGLPLPPGMKLPF